jgi:hypothetical protein
VEDLLFTLLTDADADVVEDTLTVLVPAVTSWLDIASCSLLHLLSNVLLRLTSNLEVRGQLIFAVLFFFFFCCLNK